MFSINSRNIRIIIILLLAAFILPVHSQDVAGSNIVSRTFLSADETKAIEQRVYDNGLGDVVQEVLSYPGSTLPSVIVHHEYDEYRRRTKSWLPVVSDDSLFVSGSTVAYNAVSQYSDSAPFSRTVYDSFLPLQPAALYKAGAQWQDSGKKTSVSYSEELGVAVYASEDGEIITFPDVKYLCTRTYDEDGCLYAEYTDLRGRVLISETSQGKTYYVYNAKGDMSYVFPPVLSEYITANYADDAIEDTDEMIQKYAYIYRYDHQRHCTYKKLPGCDPVYYVYDRAGHCILTQDGNQRQRSEWTYSIPDKFGRLCISGICNNVVSAATEPLHSVHVYAEYDGSSAATGGYTVHNLALADQTLHAAAYYDGYTFIGRHGVPADLTPSAVPGFSVDASLGHGLQTGSATAIFSDGEVSGYMYSAIYYDSRYRVSQVRSTNHLGGIETTCTEYSHTGKLLNVRKEHLLGGTSLMEEAHAYAYDGADRLVSHTLSVTHGEPTAASAMTYEYDALGRLSRITRPNTSSSIPDPSVTYDYDLHGWTTGITTHSFREELFYADGPGTPCYNGNISSIRWQDKKSSQKRGYRFSYDAANRLTLGSYGEGDALTTNAGRFSEAVEYGDDGNISAIARYGKTSSSGYGLMDDLTLSYDGFQLTGVSESAADYDVTGSFEYKSAKGSQYIYDRNGSLVADKSRGIAYITYDVNNNPQNVYFTNGSVTKYMYSASGRKLRATHHTAMPYVTRAFGVKPAELIWYMILHRDSTDYLLDGSLLMKDGRIDQCLFDGGYARAIETGTTTDRFVFHYFNKDHLGNNREVVDARGRIRQVTSYYPFGAPYADPAAVSSPDFLPYKYNGKELDVMHGLNAYDYGARQYDPILARWDRMDPLCESYYPFSPYTYCKDNPIKNYDPDGRAVETLWDAANVALDATSLVANVASGNLLSAAIDAGALIVDAAAAAVPFVPGGAGAAVKAYRAGRAAHATETVYKATKNNYRKVLQKTTGKTGKGYEAHHTLPQKYRKKFEELGINIDEPGNVVWRETKGHRKSSNKLTSEWDKYMRKTHTKKQVLKHRDELEKKYYENKGDRLNN